MPKFTVILPLRDEADIVPQCLDHLLRWADEIYTFDTGSVDNSWEIVQNYAAKNKRIIPISKDPVYFSETRLRGYMFHIARRKMRSGDWFLRADADEFHHIPPPEFVKTRLRKCETVVYHQYYNFCLLKSEVDDWAAGKENLTDRDRPIEERRRWYSASRYSEPRLCRYRDTMRWPSTVSFPFNAGYVARERLPIRHYPHRDPPQLNRRCLLRAVMMADRENRVNWTIKFHYWEEADWQKFITPDNLPGLRYWQQGQDLPAFHFTDHLAKPQIRAVQRFVHACFLPVLDRMRPRWPDETYPRRIPHEVVQLLDRELQA